MRVYAYIRGRPLWWLRATRSVSTAEGTGGTRGAIADAIMTCV